MHTLATVRGLFGRVRPTTVLPVALMLVAGVGCGSSATPRPAPGRPATDATLEISSPAPNGVTGPTVDLVLRLDHARVVSPTQTGGEIRPDRGHIHVLVDGKLLAMTGALTDRVPNLATGTHTIQAEFVAVDHLPFANRVVAAVTFRVR